VPIDSGNRPRIMVAGTESAMSRVYKGHKVFSWPRCKAHNEPVHDGQRCESGFRAQKKNRPLSMTAESRPIPPASRKQLVRLQSQRGKNQAHDEASCQ